MCPSSSRLCQRRITRLLQIATSRRRVGLDVDESAGHDGWAPAADRRLLRRAPYDPQSLVDYVRTPDELVLTRCNGGSRIPASGLLCNGNPNTRGKQRTSIYLSDQWSQKRTELRSSQGRTGI